MKARRFIALMLALAFAMPLLSCSSDRGRTVLEYEKARVGERMFGYWLAHYKNVYLHSVEGASDTDEFWDTELDDGQTAEEYITSVIVDNVKRYVACEWLFDYMNLKLTSDMKKEVRAGIDEICNELFEGDEEKFAEHLASLGIDEDILYDAYIMDVKAEYIREYLYGVSGIIQVPDSDRMAYLKDNYVHVIHIYVNDEFKFKQDENDEYVTGEDGHTVRVELTDEEKAAAAEKIAAIRKGIDDSTPFEELWAEYSEDKLYPDGYYLLPKTPFIPEVVDAAFGLEIGETVELHTEYGTHFLKRYDMTGTPWDDYGNEDFFDDFEDDMRAYLFTVMLSETTEKVKSYDDIISEFKLRDVPVSPYV